MNEISVPGRLVAIITEIEIGSEMGLGAEVVLVLKIEVSAGCGSQVQVGSECHGMNVIT